MPLHFENLISIVHDKEGGRNQANWGGKSAAEADAELEAQRKLEAEEELEARVETQGESKTWEVAAFEALAFE